MASTSSPTQQDIQNLAWTMLGEAYPGDTAGMSAVGSTVLNRLNQGRYGSNISQVVKAPNAYAAWGIGSQAAGQGNNPDTRFPVGSPQFNQAYQIAQALVNGNVPDTTGGAVNYRQTTPGTSWASGTPGTISIGGNTFQTTHPVPPADIPIPPGGAGYADTSSPDLATLKALTDAVSTTGGPDNGVPLARVQPFSVPAFNPFTTGDELALDPVTTADVGGITSAPAFDAGYNPATGQIQPYTTPNAEDAMHPATVADRAAQINAALAALTPVNSSGSPDDRGTAIQMAQGPVYTGQGIAGTAQLPAGVRPNVTVPSSSSGSASDAPYGGPYNELDALADTGAGNSQSWADLLNSSNSVRDNVPSTPAASSAPAYTTQVTQQLNPAYTAWMNNQTPASGIAASGSATGAVGINGIASGSLSLKPAAPVVAATPAPPKYISVTSKVPVRGVSPLAAALVGAGLHPADAAAAAQASQAQTPPPVPTLAQQVAVMTPAQLANQNPAALAALKNNQTSYTPGNTAGLMPTVDVSGQIRNTYADSSGSGGNDISHQISPF